LIPDKIGDCLYYATNCKDSCKYDIITDSLVAWFDVNNSGTTIDGASLTSLVEWSGKTITPSSGFTLNDWGLTSVDNGRTTCLSGETLTITSGDTRLVLYPVTGYTITYNFTGCTSASTSGCTSGCTTEPGQYIYPWAFHSGTTTVDGCPVGNTICLDGGLYQGFFKLDTDKPAPIKTITVDDCGNSGFTLTSVSASTEYQIMPTDFPVGWSMETWIKWDNDFCGCTPIVETFTATSTCEFYQVNWGAECDVSACTVTYTACDGSTSVFDINTPNGGTYLCSKTVPTTDCLCPEVSIIWCNDCGFESCTITATTASTVCLQSGTTLNDIYPNNKNFFFYIGTRAENKFWNDFSGETGLTTTTGIPLSRTESTEYESHIIDGGQNWFSIETPTWGGCKFCCNCGCTGDTSNSVTTGTTYSYCDQLSENALGFRITDDGRIGYRKMTVSGACYNNKFRITGTMMEEGYSEPNMVPTGNTWNHIAVTYTAGSGIKNTLPSGTLKFWVNGLVKYTVKDFIGLQLRALDEWSDKQIGVPFNMTWGGGTQGLIESQTFGGPDYSDRGLWLQQNFAGSFEGELSQLRFYEKPLNVLEIRNNFFVDCRRYCRPDTFGGSHIVQPNSEFCGQCKSGPLPPYIFVPCT
jgi:hypothetical protein